MLGHPPGVTALCSQLQGPCSQRSDSSLTSRVSPPDSKTIVGFCRKEKKIKFSSLSGKAFHCLSLASSSASDSLLAQRLD